MTLNLHTLLLKLGDHHGRENKKSVKSRGSGGLPENGILHTAEQLADKETPARAPGSQVGCSQGHKQGWIDTARLTVSHQQAAIADAVTARVVGPSSGQSLRASGCSDQYSRLLALVPRTLNPFWSDDT